MIILFICFDLYKAFIGKQIHQINYNRITYNLIIK